MKNDNFYTVQGWMINDLNLSGNELICYAIIYGFSQDGTTYFMGTLRYLQEWMNATKPTVLSILSKLIEKGLLDKKEEVIDKVRFCYYKVTEKRILTGGKESYMGGGKGSLLGGRQDSLPNNNIDIDKDNNKEKNKTNVLSKKGGSSTRFVKPTIEQIDAYIKEKKYHFTAEHFYNYYESKGWRVGNSPMKNWKAACATWECKRKSEKPTEQIDEQSTGLPDGMTEEKWTEIVLFLASRVYFISSRITPMMFVRMKELANGDSHRVMKILYQIEEKAINEGIDSFDIMTVYGELVNADRDE